jgi:KDO2-lipid IV(A) lauroyltransferase
VSRERSALRNRLEFAAYRAARGAVASLGPKALARVGAALGDLFVSAARERRDILRFNLQLAYPEMADGDRARLGREVARHFGRVTLDALRLQRIDRDAFRRGVTVVGEEHIAEAAAVGRGFVYLTAHIGLWEVAALTAGLLRPETLLVVNRPLDNPLLEHEVATFRSRFGSEPLGKRNILRAMLRHLQGQGSVGFLIDQRVRPEVGVEVPFFGHPAWTHPILARIVRKTRVPVVPACSLWEGPGRYSLTLSEPLFPDQLDEEALEDVPLTARFSQITEEMIRRRPEQWLWFHDRWRPLRLQAQAPLNVER